jgi:acetolactate decarboxylase
METLSEIAKKSLTSSFFTASILGRKAAARKTPQAGGTLDFGGPWSAAGRAQGTGSAPPKNQKGAERMLSTHRWTKGIITVWLLAIFVCAASVPGYAQVSEPKGTLFQVSTLAGLERGFFYPVTNVGQMKQHGNIGVGAFEGMDGELLILDGQAYNAMYDGKVVPVEDQSPIVYGAVALLNADRTASLQNVASYEQLQKSLEKLLPDRNIFYVFKIQATFNYLKIRSTAKQEKPYPGLASVVKNQSTFEFSNIKGTLIGFRCPAYIQGIYAPGFHLHFISEDRQKGGHLLEANLADLTAQIGYLTQMHLLLPDNDATRAVDLAVK